MVIHCLSEHRGEDTLLHAIDLLGCCTRGKSLAEAVGKMPGAVRAFLHWCGDAAWKDEEITVEIAVDVPSELNIRDADSDVLYETECGVLTQEDYARLKTLVLKSAADFQALYDSIPDKDKSVLPERQTFYGAVPRTAKEMYRHTRNVNDYYFAEITVEADREGSIYDCRVRGFERLEQKDDFLLNRVFDGSYGERWTLKKVLRRFLWHDRIHARAMYRMAEQTFGKACVEDRFFFSEERMPQE